MTEVILKTRRFLICPQCSQYEFNIEHLCACDRQRSFGPWTCRACDHSVCGTVHGDSVEVTRLEPPTDEPVLCLLRLRDLYVVVESYRREKNYKHDWYDYLLHSHSCPVNMMRRTVDIYDAAEGIDPHGIFRFIAAVPDTPELRKKIEDTSLENLFRLFGTDGTEAPTNWPERERGLIPGLAALQDAYTKTRAPKA